MLSDTAEFEGGAFQTVEPGGEVTTHSFERGDALVFQSHKQHGVAALTGRSSRRNIMVCELWEGLPRRCMRRCDQPWLPCYCRPDFTEYHRTVRGVAKASPGTSARLDPKYRCERWRLPEVARDCPRLPEVARGCPRYRLRDSFLTYD